MNKEIRKKAIVAMEFLIRNVNNEDYIMPWLANGIPDGDIEYGNFDTSQVDEDFITDKEMLWCMHIFMRTMSKAYRNGGLYIDTIVGGNQNDKLEC